MTISLKSGNSHGKTVGGGSQSGSVSVKVLRRRCRGAEVQSTWFYYFAMPLYYGYVWICTRIRSTRVLEQRKEKNSKYCIERLGYSKEKEIVGFTRQGKEAESKSKAARQSVTRSTSVASE